MLSGDREGEEPGWGALPSLWAGLAHEARLGTVAAAGGVSVSGVGAVAGATTGTVCASGDGAFTGVLLLSAVVVVVLGLECREVVEECTEESAPVSVREREKHAFAGSVREKL